MGMARESLLKIILVLALLVSVTIGISSAQTVISVESAEDIANGTTTWINVTAVNISDPDGIGSYRFKLTFDPLVVNVLDVQGVYQKNINNNEGWAIFNQIYTTPVKENGTVLARVQLKAMRGDGSCSPLNLTIERLYDPNGSPIPAIAINGTFTTLDEVPPSITFDKTNGSTVGPYVDVTATLYDLSGINESSIKVYINETLLTNGNDYNVTKVNDTTWNVNIKTNVSELLRVPHLPHDIEITVKASDTKGNSATAVLIVTAANIGFFNPYPPDNGYINTRNVTISVKYSQIEPATIKMFLDEDNVTSSIDIDEVNSTVKYIATNLDEGIHTVKVNGTGIDGKEWDLTWNFTVDVTPPTITFFTVKDSDGDGFIERGETLTAYWNVSDLYFDRVEIIYDGNVVKTIYSANASATFSLTEYGANLTLKAYDKAGNSVESVEKFYVYNNYVAYVIRSQPKTILNGQLNITKLATLDFVDPNVVYYEFIGASGFSLPLQNAERIIVPGSKANYTVIVDENANKTISRFPDTAVVYDENAMLDFYIKAPARGLIMVIKLDDSKAKDMGQDLLQKRSLENFSLENLTDLMEYTYIFDEQGWVKARYDRSTNQFTKIGTKRGQFTLQGTITEIIRCHNVDLTNGFRLSDHDTNYTTPDYSVRPVLEKGYYALVVIDVDTLNGLTALDLAVPFVVLNGTSASNKPSVESSVIVGDKVKLEFPVTFNAASAIMLKKVDYNAKVEMDLTESILETTNVTLSYSNKPLREIKLFNKSTNIYIPEGMFKGTYTTEDTNVLEINTSGLEPGEYYIYVVAIDKDYLTLYAGELMVTLTVPTITVVPTTTTVVPTTTTVAPAPAVGGGAGGGGYVVSVPPLTASAIAKYTSTTTATANQPLTVTIPTNYVEQTGVLKVEVVPEVSGAVQVVVAKVTLPSNIPPPKYPVYTYLEMAFYDYYGNAITIKSGSVEFRVSKSWLKDQNAKPEQVVFFHYKNNAWKEEPTEKVDEDSNYYYYRAKISSFSIFAVAVKPIAPTVTTPIPPPTTTVTVTTTVLPTTVVATTTPPAKPVQPSMWIWIAVVIAIIVIAVVAYYYTKRR